MSHQADLEQMYAQAQAEQDRRAAAQATTAAPDPAPPADDSAAVEGAQVSKPSKTLKSKLLGR